MQKPCVHSWLCMYIEGWSCHLKIVLLWHHHAFYLHKYLNLENNQSQKNPAKFRICIGSMSFRDGRSPLELLNSSVGTEERP